jgi:two-component system OmpR family response regulator
MRILIVEDEEALAAGLKFNFEQEGYDVSCASDGPTALKMFEPGMPKIDLVILDLMMPGMSGYEVCSTVRSNDHDVPIIILSARSMSEDRRLAFDCGTDQYLSKPFALPELLSRVRNLLERSRRRQGDAEPRGPESYAFGDVSIDFRRYEVTVRGKLHRLTELELQLLRYFVEHEGSVLTRAEIVQKVWGEKPGITTRSIDNFVLRLRRIIEINPAEPRHILSIRGAGYRFVATPEEGAPAGSAEPPLDEPDESGVG